MARSYEWTREKAVKTLMAVIEEGALKWSNKTGHF